MTWQAWVMVGLVVAVLGLLVQGRLPAWAIFVGAMAVELTLRLAPQQQVLAGFANSGVLSVVVLYVVAEAMYRTGAITIVIQAVLSRARTAPAVNRLLLPLTGGASAFLNNTPIVAMLVPAVVDFGRARGFSPSRVLLPISYASILGGTTTLMGTSTNLVIAGMASERLGTTLGVFFPTALLLPAAAVGIGLLLLLAPRMLARDVAKDDTLTGRRTYRAEFVVAGDPVDGRTLEAMGLLKRGGVRLRSLERDGQQLPIEPDQLLRAGDRLRFSGTVEGISQLWSSLGLRAAFPPGEQDREYGSRLVEVVLAAQTPVQGHPVSELIDVDPHVTRVIGWSRNGRSLDCAIAQAPLDAGDNLLLQVEEAFLDTVDERRYALVAPRSGYRIQRSDRAVAAGVIVAAMIVTTALGWLSLLNAALLAAIALVITGCIGLERALRSIDWRVYLVLACGMALEPGITETGLADLLARGLTTLSRGSPYLALVAVYAAGVLVTNVVTNTAAAALLFPVVVSLVQAMKVGPSAFLVVLMAACSYAFINPAGTPTHLLVMEPGGYQLRDLFRLGGVLTVVLGVVVVTLAGVTM